MTRSPKPGEKRNVGYGYVGVWSNGTLGWFMPTHLISARVPRKWMRHAPDKPASYIWNSGERSYLCKITVEPIRDKRGRFIVRRVREK